MKRSHQYCELRQSDHLPTQLPQSVYPVYVHDVELLKIPGRMTIWGRTKLTFRYYFVIHQKTPCLSP